MYAANVQQESDHNQHNSIRMNGNDLTWCEFDELRKSNRGLKIIQVIATRIVVIHLKVGLLESCTYLVRKYNNLYIWSQAYLSLSLG